MRIPRRIPAKVTVKRARPNTNIISGSAHLSEKSAPKPGLGGMVCHAKVSYYQVILFFQETLLQKG